MEREEKGSHRASAMGGGEEGSEGQGGKRNERHTETVPCREGEMGKTQSPWHEGEGSGSCR